MSRRIILIFLLFIGISVAAQIPTKYFIGKTEVPESLYKSVPDSLAQMGGVWNYDSLQIRVIVLPLTHSLDSISLPGEYSIRRRSEDEIKRLIELRNSYENSRHNYKLTVDASAPNFRLIKNDSGDTIPDMMTSGKCYLLNFWAVWCGNCLKELQPEYIPAVTDRYIDNTDFQFVPICIDATRESLLHFFSTAAGQRLPWLEAMTYLDIDRQANELFANPGVMPLNVVIGRDGKIKFIQTGRLEGTALTRLEEAISEGLK